MASIRRSLRLTSGFVVAAFVLGTGFQNCSQVEFGSVEESSGVKTDGRDVGTPPIRTLNLNVASASDYVCSPFGSVTVPSGKGGLKAELRYMDPMVPMTVAEKNSVNSVDYFQDTNPNFIKMPQPIYLTEVNVPTRNFTQGFSTSAGAHIMDRKGQILTEYFALKMETLVKLGSDDPEGYYEFATISDDGTVVQVMIDGMWQSLIGNDGPHSTKMGCGTFKIRLDRSSLLPVRIYYNQGPRTEIANVLVWNYRGPDISTDAGRPSDNQIKTYCGFVDRFKFWSSTDSTPGLYVNEILGAQDWRALKASNFQLPNDEVNPCAYSPYDEIDKLASVLNSDNSISVDLTLKTVASVTAKVYGPAGVLLQTYTLSSGLTAQFTMNPLTPGMNYRLELIINVPSKSLVARKEFALRID